MEKTLKIMSCLTPKDLKEGNWKYYGEDIEDQPNFGANFTEQQALKIAKQLFKIGIYCIEIYDVNTDNSDTIYRLIQP